jgi:ankyrin repeat protein
MSSLVSLLTANGNASVVEVQELLLDVDQQSRSEAIRLATRTNNAAVMDLLLSHGVVDDMNDPLVCVAARCGHIDALQVLRAHGLSLDTLSVTGMSALRFACQKRHFAVFEWLLSHGASTADKPLRDALLVDAMGNGSPSVELLRVLLRENLCDDVNDPKLCLLLRARSVEAAELLLAHGASATQEFTLGGRTIASLDRCGDSAALTRLLLRHGAGADRAALNRALFEWQHGPLCIDALSVLLEAGADPNAIDKATGDSALMRATQDQFKVLIEAGANVNHKNHSGESVLMRAAKILLNGFVGVVGELLTAGAIPDVHEVDDFGRSLLDLCCHGDETIDVIEKLLSRGANVNLPNNQGSTPLHGACSARNLPLIKLLLVHNADVHAIDDRHQTPAHRALTTLPYARRDPAADVFAIVCCLISAGVDVDALDNASSAILHLAAVNCLDVRVVETILQTTALVNHCADFGTPLSYAASGGIVAIGRALVRAGANAAATMPVPHMKQTPLHVAAVANRADFVEFLISECGVSVDVFEFGFSALQQACAQRSAMFPLDAVIVLLLYGADFGHVVTVPDAIAPSLEDQLELFLRSKLRWDVDEIAAAIGKLRVAAIRRRGAEIVIALQGLELPAHQTVLILKQALASVAAMRYKQLWQLVTCVKHFK